MDWNKEFCFSTEIAKEVGLVPALVFECLAIFIHENAMRKSKACFKHGKYWGEINIDQIMGILPFLSEYQIKKAVHRLTVLFLIEVDDTETEKKCAFGETKKDYVSAYWRLPRKGKK